MATVTLDNLLKPDVVLGTISRTRFAFPTFSRFLGLIPDAMMTDESVVNLNVAGAQKFPTRSVSVDIYNRVRSGTDLVAPLSPAKRIAVNPVGSSNYTVGRIHPSIYLEWDRMTNRREIGSGATVLDVGGQKYVTRQLATLAQKVFNTIEIMALGLTRDLLYMAGTATSIDSWTPTFTSSGAIGQINAYIPSGNLTTLNMDGGGAIIDATWATDTTKILTHLNKIDDGFAYGCGYPLRDVWVNGIWWNYIINNTEVRTAAGTTNSAFSSFDYVDGLGAGKDRDTLPYRKAELRTLPGVTFHILNERIDVAGTTVKKIPDGRAYFFPALDEDCIQLGTYAEMISEQPGQPATPHDGLTTWTQFLTNPSVIEVFALLNCIPMIKIPSSFAYGSINNA